MGGDERDEIEQSEGERSRWTPERRAKMASTMTAAWTDPTMRARRAGAAAAALATQAVRDKVAAAKAADWADPDKRERMLAGIASGKAAARAARGAAEVNVCAVCGETIKRAFCRRCAAAEAAEKRAARVERSCPLCGSRIHNKGALYCGLTCANEARRKRWHDKHPDGIIPKRAYRQNRGWVQKPLAPAECGYCRDTFEPTTRRQIYCRPQCRRKANKEVELGRMAKPGRPNIPSTPMRTLSRRERETAAHAMSPISATEAGAPSPERDERQEPPRRWFRLICDPRVVIGPGRPAPVKRYEDGSPMPFRDDLEARANHGSPRHQMPLGAVYRP